MCKLKLILLLLFVSSIQVSAQWLDFPVYPIDPEPKTKLKGAVHTVLTIKQRGEEVFSTDAEVYDKSGKIIERLSSNANKNDDGVLFRTGGKTIFTYDSGGKLIKEKHFTPEGEYSGYTTYTYNSKNFLVERIFFDAKDREMGKTTFTHFPEKRVIEARWLTNKVVLTYNEKYQWIERGGSMPELTGWFRPYADYEYDNDGNLIKQLNEGNWHDYSYQFDKQGNWVEKENTYVHFDGDDKKIVNQGWQNEYRIITYYFDNKAKP